MAEWIEIIPKPEGGEEIASPLAMAEWIEIWEKEGLNVIDAGLR